MKKGFSKLLAVTLLLAMFTSVMLVQQATAINSSYGDGDLNYLAVSSNPDVVKQGATVNIAVNAKLADNLNQTDIFHVKVYADTANETAKMLADGYLILNSPVNETAPAGQYLTTVVIPTDAITNTYVYATISDQTGRTYSRITLALIQPNTYYELQNQLDQLQAQNNSLQSTNNTTTLLLYVTLAVAAIFIVTTGYIISLTIKAKKKQNTPLS
jgi:hypothetical protein